MRRPGRFLINIITSVQSICIALQQRRRRGNTSNGDYECERSRNDKLQTIADLEVSTVAGPNLLR